MQIYSFSIKSNPQISLNWPNNDHHGIHNICSQCTQNKPDNYIHATWDRTPVAQFLERSHAISISFSGLPHPANSVNMLTL